MAFGTTRKMALAVMVATAGMGGAAQAADTASDCAGYGDALDAMSDADRALRGRQDYLAAPEDAVQARRGAQLSLVERANAARLEALVAGCGWPLRSVHGARAVEAAWQVVKRFGGNLTLQKTVAPHLERAVAAGEAPGAALAQLQDRIAVAEGRLQPYGTQMRQRDACRWVPQAMEDRALVEERRKALGLPSLEEQERQANGMVIHEGCENHVALPRVQKP